MKSYGIKKTYPWLKMHMRLEPLMCGVVVVVTVHHRCRGSVPIT